MERKVFRYALGVVVCAFLVSSCPSAVSHKGSGIVRISLGASSARGILDPPVFPLFSSATVTVSGDGMASVSAAVVNGVASVDVPAGEDRVVTVDAVPDWTATKAAYPSSVPVTNATRYGGTATVSVQSGRTSDVAIHLSITESQIVLASVKNQVLFFAKSFSGVASATNEFGDTEVYKDMDFELDRYGRLYASNWDPYYMTYSVSRYDGGGPTAPVLTDIIVDSYRPLTRMALDAKNGRIYYVGHFDTETAHGSPAGYYEAATSTHAYFNEPTNLPGNWDIYQIGLPFRPAIAVDENGLAILPLFDRGADEENIGDESYYVTTATFGSPHYSSYEGDNVVDTTIGTIVTFAAADLNDGSGKPLVVEDMAAIGDTVYILARDVDHESRTRSRGKIVALRTADLGNPRSAGWSEAAYPTDPSSQFYGPARFIGIAPGKLYVADDGYSSPYANANRVVEVTLDPLSISGVSAVPSNVTFFEEY